MLINYIAFEISHKYIEKHQYLGLYGRIHFLYLFAYPKIKYILMPKEKINVEISLKNLKENRDEILYLTFYKIQKRSDKIQILVMFL